MMTEAAIQDIPSLRVLQQESEARGMRFYVNPPREVIPAFLGGHRPDAIAQGPEGGIIIEVLDRTSRAAQQQAAEVARVVSGQKGWEFRALFLNRPVDDIPAIRVPTRRQVQAALSEIEKLAKGGHYAAALLAAWAILEALARLALVTSGAAASRPLSLLQAIQALAAEGYLENDGADLLRGTVQLRNAIVHGDLSAEVPAEQVQAVLTQVQAIAASIEAVQA